MRKIHAQSQPNGSEALDDISSSAEENFDGAKLCVTRFDSAEARASLSSLTQCERLHGNVAGSRQCSAACMIDCSFLPETPATVRHRSVREFVPDSCVDEPSASFEPHRSATPPAPLNRSSTCSTNSWLGLYDVAQAEAAALPTINVRLAFQALLFMRDTSQVRKRAPLRDLVFLCAATCNVQLRVFVASKAGTAAATTISRISLLTLPPLLLRGTLCAALTRVRMCALFGYAAELVRISSGVQIDERIKTAAQIARNGRVHSSHDVLIDAQWASGRVLFAT